MRIATGRALVGRSATINYYKTMPIIEPGKQPQKLKSYLDSGKYNKVLLVFWHGIGDVIQFLNIFDKLKSLYPDIYFDVGLQKGLDEETIIPEAILLPDLKDIERDWDLTALIHFPVETDPTLTKSELCCREELGIEPVSGHKKLPDFPSPIVAVHFCLTALPGLANPSEEVAHKIWNEIHDVGLVPIESHFSHVFDNPENKMFPWIETTVRKCQARLSSLFGLLKVARFFVGVVSGPFHSAMSILPHDRICFLEKDIPVARFTHENIKTVDIKKYTDGSIKDWLNKQIKEGL